MWQSSDHFSGKDMYWVNSLLFNRLWKSAGRVQQDLIRPILKRKHLEEYERLNALEIISFDTHWTFFYFQFFILVDKKSIWKHLVRLENIVKPAAMISIGATILILCLPLLFPVKLIVNENMTKKAEWTSLKQIFYH